MSSKLRRVSRDDVCPEPGATEDQTNDSDNADVPDDTVFLDIPRELEYLSVDEDSDSDPDNGELTIDHIRGEIKLPSQICVDFASDSEGSGDDDADDGSGSESSEESPFSAATVPWTSYEADLEGHIPVQRKVTPVVNLRRVARVVSWIATKSKTADTPVKHVSRSRSTVTFRQKQPRSNTLSVTQAHSTQATCLFKVSAFLETYCNGSKPPGFDPKTMKSVVGKPKLLKVDLESKMKYGASLYSIVQKTGLALPPYVINCLNHLHKNYLKEQGLFRRAGSAKRVHMFQAECEETPYEISFDGLTSHDVADAVKHFYRDLPERVFNAKMTSIITTLTTSVPEELRLYALQCAIQLLPDVNREAAYLLISFLKAVSEHEKDNSMSITNLAVCWTPTLFTLTQTQIVTAPGKPKPKSSNSKETGDVALTQTALELLIAHADDAFYPAAAVLMSEAKPKAAYDAECSFIQDLGADSSGYPNIMLYLKTCAEATLKEHTSAYRGWTQFSGVPDTYFKKVSDGHPLRIWRSSTDIPATAGRTVWRILRERYLWDDDLLQDRIVETLTDTADIYQYVQRAMFGGSRRSFICVRSQHAIDGVHLISMTSVQHQGDFSAQDAIVRAVNLAIRFLVEPFGSTCRLSVIIRQDVRGYTPHYYKYGYGPYSSTCALRIRDSFQSPT